MSTADDNMLRLREADLEWRRVGEEIIVLDLRENRYLSINAAGVVLWGMLTEGSAAEEMRARLMSEFGIEEDRARGDVEEFIAMLSGRGLLE